ncbi:hypothetical protein BJ878DRAFT_38335, partial [Calycina marina]
LLLCNDSQQSIQLADWNALVNLPSRLASDVREQFYPNGPLEEDLELVSSEYRRTKFLVSLDDEIYHSAYEAVLQFSDQRFPDIQATLRTSRNDGKAISRLMSHVVQWLNPSPSEVGDRENNKPQLWRDLIYPFTICSNSSQGSTEGQARELQRQIFDIVRGRVGELSSLTVMPDKGGDAYLERFQIPIWKEILIAVHPMIGAQFQGVLAKFNTQDPATIISQRESTLISAIRLGIRQVPEVAQNPALRSDQALDIIMTKITPFIVAWASEQCTEALRVQRSGQAPPWPPSILQSVTSELKKLETMLPQPKRRTVPWLQSSAVPQSSLRSNSAYRISP